MKYVALSGVLIMLAALSPAQAASFDVVGGSEAAEGAWPSTVALARAEDGDDVSGQFCAGTVVAEDLVLTAAHCLRNDDETWRQPEQIRVLAGRHDLNQPGGVARVGVEVYLHPAYDSVRRRNDVAVLRVSGPLDAPVQRLASSSSAAQPGATDDDGAVVVGWGRTGQNDTQASATTVVLKQATVDIATDEDCAQAFGGSLDLSIHLCAGGQGSEEEPQPDACRGDSGGPLFVVEPGGRIVQHGITSFGSPVCGVGEPGVYTRVGQMRPFIDDALAGRVPATRLPVGGEPTPATTRPRQDPVRVAPASNQPQTPIDQAIAASRAVFSDGGAELAVVTRDDGYADALAGSSLAYGRGPVLFTPSTGELSRATREELLRAVQPGGMVYLLGGEAAVPAGIQQELTELGFEAIRLAGFTRESTAAIVAAEVVTRHGFSSRPPFGTAILVTSQAWPDAVLAGQLGVWWGFPILLTTPEGLHPDAREALRSMTLNRVLIVGGTSAVSSRALEEVYEIAPAAQVQRLAGDTRVETGLALAAWHRAELARLGEPAPDVVAAVNVRTDLGFAYILAATPIVGATAGMFLPVEGMHGDVLTPATIQAFCGVGGRPFVIGGSEVVSAGVAEEVADLVAGLDCLG
ncbi:MAG: trypsin-like serine protease [Euzebya sp.]